ncbi:MAG: two-component regulator propeller domain-containing protein, partial [Bacteroides sp.]
MKPIATLFLLCCLSSALRATDGGNLLFKHLEMKDNLSHYSVMSLYQDAHGLIWMGTRNGVSVFDGQEMHQYHHQPDDPTSIMNNYVRGITGNGSDRIYFLTLRGICYFDALRERFQSVTEEQMTAFCYDRRLYMAAGRTVFAERDAGREQVVQLPDEGGQVMSLAAHGDSLLIGTEEHGLYLYELGQQRLTPLIPKVHVGHLFRDRSGTWWVGTWDNGLFRLDAQGITNYRHRDGDPHSLCSDFIRSCCEDAEGNLWVGTFRGLSKLPRGAQQFVNYYSIQSTSPGVDSSVWSLLCDAQGTIWVGTYFNGVSYFNPQLSFYRSYPVEPEGQGGLSFPVVGSMTEDDAGHLWICTDGGGLNCLDRATGRFTHYLHTDNPSSLSHNNVKCVYFDRLRQKLWIGTHLGGLNCLDLNSKRITRYLCSINGRPKELANIVCDIVPHGEELLLATHDGVYSFEVATGRFTQLFQQGNEEERISLALDLQLDARGRLWIGGAQRGAYCYDFATRELKLYSHQADDPNSLSSNGVSSIDVDDEGRLWFCLSETGLDLYRPETDDFLHFDERRNGLLSNCVYGACSISPNQLLVITDKGFSCLDIAKGSFRNVDVSSGLPLSAINQKALFKTADHQIFIGGIDGLVSFAPEDLN